MSHQQRKDRVEKRFHQIRQVVNELSLRKLKKLDYGDTALIAGMLDKLYWDIHRIRVIADAGCSQLIELLEYGRRRLTT